MALSSDENRTAPATESLAVIEKPLGSPERKHLVDLVGLLALVVSLLCLIGACVSVSPGTPIPWRLGLKRQLQVVGLLLSVMIQCFLVVMPKFFIIVEARFGQSRIQNFEAIQRNSVFKDHIHLAWRAALLTLVILPIGLSLAYKEFQHGTSSISGSSSLVGKSNINFYGLTGPARFTSGRTEALGISLMANATLPFVLATQDDPELPKFPQAYGFNVLALSDTSTAAFDAPMPDYVESMQQSLNTDERVFLTAKVYATITAYNQSIDSHRGDDDFWQYYNKLSNTSDFSQNIVISDMYARQSFGFLVSDLRRLDTSFCFTSFQPSNTSDFSIDFKNNARLWSTQRGTCTATWRITYDSINIVDGFCDQSPLPESSQNIFRYASFAMGQYFVPSLVEYLQTFSRSRSHSPWMMSIFSTVLNTMYWARATTLNGYDSWGDKKTIFVDPDPTATQRSEIYYPVEDEHIVWERRTMNSSGILYFVFAIQPLLTSLIFVADLIMHRVPISRGFGLVSLLAGIRADNLKMLEGASLSGKIDRPLRVRVAVAEPEKGLKDQEKDSLRIEYVLRDKRKTGTLPSWRRSNTPTARLPWQCHSRRDTQHEIVEQ